MIAPTLTDDVCIGYATHTVFNHSSTLLLLRPIYLAALPTSNCKKTPT